MTNLQQLSGSANAVRRGGWEPLAKQAVAIIIYHRAEQRALAGLWGCGAPGNWLLEQWGDSTSADDAVESIQAMLADS